MKQYLVLIPLIGLLGGCPVFQSQSTPVPAIRTAEADSGAKYWCYVPSYHTTDRDWPLVVTLHGTYGFESSRLQIKEWKHLAEQKGFVVVAPDLRSVQGILPVSDALWFRDLDRDEETILAVMDEVTAKYRIDPNSVLLTGFSAGGYPMYHVGLRNPRRFNMLVARACNSSVSLFERLELTDEARRVPVRIFWGKDDLKPIANQSWEAYRWLVRRGFKWVEWKKISGGHIRRPDIAYAFWRKVLPARHRR